MSCPGLSDLHIVPRGQILTSDFYMDEKLKGMPASRDEATDGKRASNSGQTSARHVTGHFSTGRRPSSHRRQDTAMVPGQLHWLLGEGCMVWKQPSPVARRKPLEDRPGQGGQDEPGDVKATLIENVRSAWSCFSAKTTGQPDVWDAGAYEGLCGECGELINYQFHDQSLFVFLLLDAIEGAINFGTLCTVYMHI